MQLVRLSSTMVGIGLLFATGGSLSAQSSNKQRHDKKHQQPPPASSERIITKTEITIPPPTEINFTDLANYELSHPPKHKRRFIEQGEDREREVKLTPKPVPPGAIIFHLPDSTENNPRAPQRNSPVPTGYWNGIMDNNTLIPPDIQGAAGITYVIQTTNQQFNIYTKSGTLVSTLSIISMFSSTGGNSYFDPHCTYDPNNGRYIICIDGNASDGNGGLFVAISETNDPTGAWYVYGFDGIGNPNDFLDYPLLGYNTNWVVITGNDFLAAGPVVGKVYVMNRASLYSGTLGTVTAFTDNGGSGNSPAETRDAAQATEYIVQDVNGDQGGIGYVQIESITGTAAAPVYNTGNTLGTNRTWDEGTIGATQSGTGNTIECGDTRISDVICENNTLWFSHNVPLPAGNPTHYGVDWWQVNPAVPSISQFGRIEDPNGVIFYYYPSVSVNAAGDALLGYCTSSPSTYASAAYSFHASTDAANTMQSIDIYKNGLAAYYKTLGGGRNRWGDFTGTTTDPVDNSFWNFSEWANTGSEWATVIAHVAASSTVCFAHAAYTYSNPTSCSAPFTVSFINTSTSSNSFLWEFGDGDTSTALNPSHTYTSQGLFNVKLIAISTGTCGKDSTTIDSLVNITSAIPCVVIMPTTGTAQTQTSCIGTLYDDGGPDANYSDNSNSTITISPTGATNVKLHFTQFAMETSYDFLYVYDGPSTSSPLIAALTGMNIPADITSSGPSITIQQTSDEAVNYAGYAISWNCIIPNSPPAAAFAAVPTNSCTGTIHFNNLSTGATSWIWYFGDGTTSTAQSPTHNYLADGIYMVSLVGINSFGRDSVSKINCDTISKPVAPTTTGATSCNAGKFTISAASSDTINWYAGATDTTPVFVGNPFTTPTISATTTYYAEDLVPGPTYQAGPPNNNFGTSGYLAYSWFEVFNVLKSCVLSSVYVYADGAGDRTFQLLDNNANVLASATVNLPNGGSRITLNFNLPAGNSYMLGVPSTSTVNLMRNSSGATYPYNDPGGYVSIIGNTANDLTRYYWCYDWIIQSPPCVSLRKPTTVTIGSTVNASISSTNSPTCFGYTNGSATVSSTGGAPTVTYKWSNNQTGATATNLGAGTVSVTATDAVGCSTSVSKTISQPTAVVITPSVTNVSCNGGNNGSINLSVTGGTPNYTYNWGGGITSQNRTGLAIGPYNVTVTDASGCSATASKTITQPNALVPALTATNVSCNGGNNGSINLTATGGTTPYTYNWGNSITSQNRTNLTSGTYTVTITDSLACSASASKTISQPIALSIVPLLTNVSCYGGNNGSINLTVTGGTPNYGYNWGGGITTQNRSGLISGSYTVTITDAANCTATVSKTISQPTVISPVLSGTNVSCNGGANGSINVTTTGGTPSYSYSWGSGVTSQNRTGLASGTYNVTVTDSASCSVTASKTISQPTAISATATPTNVSCNGGANGSITLTVSGGTPSYNYNWGSSITAPNRNGLVAGTYHVTVTDSAGCTDTLSKVISQPLALTIVPNKTDATCGLSNGSASVTVSGGTSGYSYLWAGNQTTSSISNIASGNYKVTVTDAHNCSTSLTIAVNSSPTFTTSVQYANDSCYGSSDGTISVSVTGGTNPIKYLWSNNNTSSVVNHLNQGTYYVTVTDSVGCTAVLSQNISQPTAINIAVTVDNTICSEDNGIAAVHVTGGTPGYSYQWDSTSNATSSISGLAAGNYYITVTDLNHCQSTAVAVINYSSSLHTNLSFSNTSCYRAADGSASVNAVTGTAPFHYLWSIGATDSSISNLPAANYYVIVTDSNHCQGIDSFTITQPGAISISLNITSPSCHQSANGSVAATATGGIPNYSFVWSTGITADTLSNLIAGNYSVAVHDGNNCTADSAFNISSPAALSLVPTVNDVSCFSDSDGNIFLSVHGGIGPLTYLWNTGGTNNGIGNLVAGNYYVTVTDNHHCTATDSIFVSQPQQFYITTSSTNTPAGQNTGTASVVNLNGGVPPYLFNWNNGDTTQSISDLAIGTYLVTVTDKNGCQIIGTAIVGLSVGLPALSVSIPFNLIPNPANTQVIIDVPGFDKEMKMKLYDVLGQAVIGQIISTPKTVLDISILAQGVYTVELKQGDLKTIRQLVVTR